MLREESLSAVPFEASSPSIALTAQSASQNGVGVKSHCRHRLGHKSAEKSLQCRQSQILEQMKRITLYLIHSRMQEDSSTKALVANSTPPMPYRLGQTH